MKAGRKPKYETPAQMQKAIDKYFESLYQPVIVRTKSGEVYPLIDDVTGKQVREQAIPATMTGLARALNMTTEGLREYKKKDEFSATVTRARLRVQEYAETRLYDKEGQKGAEFSLRVNFGWIPADIERELRIKEKNLEFEKRKLELQEQKLGAEDAENDVEDDPLTAAIKEEIKKRAGIE